MHNAGFDPGSEKLIERKNRFGSNSPKSTWTKESNNYIYAGIVNGGGNMELTETDFERMTVVGTCTIMEKEYVRLTSSPKPESTRTVATLMKWQDHLVALIKADSYAYPSICSQYKAIRQDLTVQTVNSSFAVIVYETHARVALEHKDLNERTNFKSFFKLYLTAPKMSAYIMDHMVPRVRYQAVSIFCLAYKPNLDMVWLVGMAGFYVEERNEYEGTTAEEERGKGKRYLASCGCLLEEKRGGRIVVNTKKSILAMPVEAANL